MPKLLPEGISHKRRRPIASPRLGLLHVAESVTVLDE